MSQEIKKLSRLGYTIYLSLILALCSSFLLLSCQKNEQGSPSLVGRWEMTGHNTEEKVLTLCLYEDSTFTMSSDLGGVPQSGTWTVSQDSLKCYGNRNDFSGRTKDYYEFILKIVRHNEKELFLGDFGTKQVMELERIHE